MGLDLIVSWKANYNFGSLAATLAGNVNNMYITDVNTDLDEGTFFGARERSFLLASAPRSKFVLNTNYNTEKFNAGLSFTRFSDITLVDFSGNEDLYSAKITTDLSLAYQLAESFKLTLGSNNIFNRYPDQQDDGDTEAGGYWDAVQMGFSGAYYFARLDFNF